MQNGETTQRICDRKMDKLSYIQSGNSTSMNNRNELWKDSVKKNDISDEKNMYSMISFAWDSRTKLIHGDCICFCFFFPCCFQVNPKLSASTNNWILDHSFCESEVQRQQPDWMPLGRHFPQGFFMVLTRSVISKRGGGGHLLPCSLMWLWQVSKFNGCRTGDISSCLH